MFQVLRRSGLNTPLKHISYHTYHSGRREELTGILIDTRYQSSDFRHIRKLGCRGKQGNERSFRVTALGMDAAELDDVGGPPACVSVSCLNTEEFFTTLDQSCIVIRPNQFSRREQMNYFHACWVDISMVLGEGVSDSNFWGLSAVLPLQWSGGRILTKVSSSPN